MIFLARIFASGSSPRPVPIANATLGELTWNDELRSWAGRYGSGGSTIIFYVAGDPRTGPDRVAVQEMEPLVSRLPEVVVSARDYLAQQFSIEARRQVAVTELSFLDLSAYAGKRPHVEANFEWNEEPDWFIRVRLENGLSVSWGVDR